MRRIVEKDRATKQLRRNTKMLAGVEAQAEAALAVDSAVRPKTKRFEWVVYAAAEGKARRTPRQVGSLRELLQQAAQTESLNWSRARPCPEEAG